MNMLYLNKNEINKLFELLEGFLLILAKVKSAFVQIGSSGW